MKELRWTEEFKNVLQQNGLSVCDQKPLTQETFNPTNEDTACQ